MIRIDLLHPRTIDTFAQKKAPASKQAPVSVSAPAPDRERAWPAVVGINIVVLVVVIAAIMLIPPDALPSGFGEIVRQAQKALTRLFNIIM